MSQVQNLLQMFMDRANPPAASVKGKEVKVVGTTEKPTSPFHAKVVASHAQLAANTTKAKAKANANAQSRTLNAMDKATGNTLKNQGHVENHKVKNFAEKPVQSKPADFHHASPIKAKPTISKNDDKTSGTARAEISKGSTQGQIKANSSGEEIENGTPSAPMQANKAEIALRNRLEKMGITATDEQLADSDFLSDMLQLLQSMMPTGKIQMPQGQEGSEEVESITEITDGSDNADQAGEAGTSPAVSPDQLNKQESNNDEEIPLENDSGPSVGMGGVQNQISEKANPLGNDKNSPEKNLAELIKDRLFELSQDSKAQNNGQSNMPRMAMDPGQLNWQNSQQHQEEATLGADADVKGELDRLRVMQASLLNAGKNDEPGQDHAELKISEGSSTEIQESGTASVVGVDKSSAKGQHDGQPGGFEHNQDQTQSAHNATQQNGTALTKDSTGTNVFHHSLERVQVNEQSAKDQQVRAPHQAAFDQGILQQISKKLTAVSLRNAGEISIQMEPENLGKIRVGLGLKDGIMTARIGVENEEVRQIVQANLQSLRDTLENQGISLQGLDVSVEHHHSSLFNPDGSNSEAFFHQRSHGEGLSPGKEVPNLEIAPESDTGRRWGYNTLEYIG